MVQYVFTPWRNRAELLEVRRQFYPRPPPPQSQSPAAGGPTPSSPGWTTTPQEGEDVQKAIARVFMWMHRGNCPHVVESTAMLMAAIVQDGEEGRKRAGGAEAVGGYAVRAAYLTAFTRFVTGLLDGHQDKTRKLSMYGIAKTIGLPTSFVELRHQGTHEPLPSLTQLRPAARKALVWIWDYYWRHLPDEDDDGERADYSTDVGSGQGAGSGLKERMCRATLMGYLQRDEAEVGEDAKEAMMRQLKQWDQALVMRLLSVIGESARDSKVLLRSLKLSRELLASSTAETKSSEEGKSKGTEPQDDTEGWSRYEGAWTPKPIGVV